jgi:hypothetical protein
MGLGFLAKRMMAEGLKTPGNVQVVDKEMKSELLV